MKIIIIFLLVYTFSYAQNYQAYQVYTKEGKKTTFEKVLKASKDKKAIFFGELHNDPIAHWLQYETLVYLFNQHQENLLCGSEMFERDNQQAINSYLKGTLDEKNLKDSVRLWPNFHTDYLPMLQFAKEKNIKMDCK
jgi:uncharacterized iron-regulated protein